MLSPVVSIATALRRTKWRLGRAYPSTHMEPFEACGNYASLWSQRDRLPRLCKIYYSTTGIVVHSDRLTCCITWRWAFSAVKPVLPTASIDGRRRFIRWIAVTPSAVAEPFSASMLTM
ncbi:hypothetical protein TcWFU_004345 [Taenia crassiceps]|uniref:Uncharacterized protein n=1 Tax=Taenia crassiceps TaxID=6207 RepID=A0ABR4QQG1_9CEST